MKLLPIFTIALVVRVAYVLAQWRWALFFGGDFQSADTRLYFELAHSLLAGDGLSSPGPISWKENGYPFAIGPTAFVMPGYPALLAACQWLFGESVLAVKLVQSVFGAMACVCIARLSARLFGNRAGWIAGLIAALFYELVFTVTALATEPVYICLAAGMLWGIVAALSAEPSRWRPFALAGALFGAAALFRPQTFFVAMCIAVGMTAFAVRERRHERIAHAMLFLACCAVVLLPWGVRNQLVMGRFTWLSTEGGYVLWLGNNPGYDQLASDYSQFGGYSAAAVIAPLPATRGKSEMEAQRMYQQAARVHIVAHPWLFIRRAPHKLWNMLRPVAVGTSPRHKITAWLVYPALLAASAIGVFFSRRMANVWPLYLFVAVTIALHATAVGVMRFRLPLWAALLPFAGLALARFSSPRSAALSGPRPAPLKGAPYERDESPR